MNITPGEWQAHGAIVETDSPPNGVVIAAAKGPPPIAAANARAIAQVPRMLKLLEAIEAYQKDGLNRWDWIQGEVNSVLKEIRGG